MTRKTTVKEKSTAARADMKADMTASVKENPTPTVKVKKPRGGSKSPVIGNNGLILEKGDNTKYLSLNMALLEMPNIDLNDPVAVQQRLMDYFELYAEADLKPTLVGMATALNGHGRTWLRGVVHDIPTGGKGYKANIAKESASVIKKTYFLLENLWETYMQNGKINPVAGIFLGKNNYGYQDKTEYVVTPNTQNEEEYDVNDIKKRYATTIETTERKQLSDSATLSGSDSSDSAE